MRGISPIPFPHVRSVPRAPMRPHSTEEPVDADRIVEHFVHRGILRRNGQAARVIRSIFTAPPEALRVGRMARRIHLSRRTLGRRLQVEGVPAPVDWNALARVVLAHKTILRGGPLRDAAWAAGYHDQFTMSNAIHRITALRPSQLRDVNREELLDTWIARQRERGTLTGPPPVPPHICPLCKGVRAS